MKSYILKLLAQSNSEAAKMLTEVINTSGTPEYSENGSEDYFTFFVSHTLETDELYQRLSKYSDNSKQVVEETPVCWSVRNNCFVKIWLE